MLNMKFLSNNLLNSSLLSAAGQGNNNVLVKLSAVSRPECLPHYSLLETLLYRIASDCWTAGSQQWAEQLTASI